MNFDGQYEDKQNGRVYLISSILTSGSGSIIGATFETECGKKASAITMKDGSVGMILDDKTILTRLV